MDPNQAEKFQQSLAQVWEAAGENRPDFGLLERLALAAAEDIDQRNDIHKREVTRAVHDLRDAGFPADEFDFDAPNPQNRVEGLKTQLASALQELERKTDIHAMSSAFLATKTFLEQIDAFPLKDLTVGFVEIQNNLAVIAESVADSTDTTALHSAYKTKLAKIDAAIQRQIEVRYIEDPNRFVEEIEGSHDSLPILEKIAGHLFAVALRRHWESNNVAKIESLRRRLSEIQGGILRDQLTKMTEEFVRRQGTEALRRVEANQLPDSELRSILDRLEGFRLRDVTQLVRLKVLAQSSLSHFGKLLAVRTTLINYFVDETLSREEFETYISLNAPSLDNVFRLLGLEDLTQNRFLVERYVFNFYSTIYQLINFLAIEGSPMKKDKFRSLTRLQRLFFQRLQESGGLAELDVLLEMHAHSELIVLDQMHKRKLVAT